MATFSELQEEVLSHQFSPLQYRSYVKDRLNQGEAYVTAQTDFRELQDVEVITTVLGTADSALPSNFQRLVNATIELDSGTVIPLVSESVPNIYKHVASSGRPERYAIDGGNIRLWPTPDSAYTVNLRYYRTPAPMSATTDLPSIPPEYHHLLVSYALWHCWERENDWNAAQYHKARFDEDIAKCRGEAQYDSDDYTQPRIVGEGRTDALSPNAWVL